MGSGILTTYPQISVIAGVQGLIVYTLSSSLPLMIFALFGPTIRKQCPDGFVLTEWCRERYGKLTALYLSFFTIATMFLYMVAELSAVQLAISSLTGLNALPALIVECAITTIYTSWGGFHVSFFTDNVQGIMVFLLLIICSIAMGTNIHIDKSLIEPSGLLEGSALGYKLIYILPVAVATNDCFLSGFWLRTFASKSDRDLYIGTTLATIVVTIFLVLVGATGLIAAWTPGLYPGEGDINSDGSASFFVVLSQLPAWVLGFVVVFTVTLSTSAFDSLQSAMASSISNDIFNNKLPVMWVRGIVILLMIPSVVVAIKAPNILVIYLISDLLSAAVVPVLFLGLSRHFFFVTGWEVISSGLGGLLSVFIFGSIYYGSALEGAQLILLENGIYVDDWSAFGAFVVAPFGGMVFGAIVLVIRLLVLYAYSKRTATPFTALDKSSRAKLEDEDEFVGQIITNETEALPVPTQTKQFASMRHRWI